MTLRWIRGSLVLPDRVIADGLLELAGGKIAGIRDLSEGSAGAGSGPGLDLAGRFICPGFIDLHVHGGGGADFTDATAEAVEAVTAAHARGGTTALLATTLSLPEEQILATLRTVRAVAAAGGPASGPRLLGYHVEGPFLNPTRRGAQNAAFLRLPDAGEIERWLQAGGPPAPDGPVWQITLAPELPGAMAAIADLHRQGVLLSAGHTDATYEQMVAAVAAGLSGVTHLFNGMSGLHHREAGVVGAALTLAPLGCELIADCLHVAPPVLRLAVAAKGVAGVNLITDAIRAAGLGDGLYQLGGTSIQVAAGAARTAEGGLAGRLLTMDRAVGNMVRVAQRSLPEVVAMASLIPARRIGLHAHTGSLAAGKDADIAVLDPQFRCTLTLVAGRVVYEA